jgi:RNA methyltransferase, TrmH family
LGPRHHEVQRLRALLRDPQARRAEGAFVLEGPRVVDAALERGALLDAAYLSVGADAAFPELVERLAGAEVPVRFLKEGVLEKLGTTRTPQPVLGLAARVDVELDQLARDGLVIVAASVSDPGNAGTLIRSAEAAGITGIVFCGNSVDVHNPKVVRSSAGAIFGVPVVEAHDPVQVLVALGAQGRRRYGTAASGGAPFDAADLTRACAIVLGNEAHGMPAAVAGELDELLTIPMTGAAESLNVAMTGTVLCFEAARQRGQLEGDGR